MDVLYHSYYCLMENEIEYQLAPHGESSFLHNVKVMAHPLARANVDRGVEVEIRCGH
jgi:hypothetical protein